MWGNQTSSTKNSKADMRNVVFLKSASKKAPTNVNFSGHVKVKMTRSEIAMLDSLPSELDTSRSSTVLSENSKQRYANFSQQ